METLDPRSFLLSIHPFDRLGENDLTEAVNSLDIIYFKPGDTILEKDAVPEHYFIVAKGTVEEVTENDSTYYTAKDTFDAPSLFRKKTASRFLAAEETLVFAMPAEEFLRLVAKNEAFESYYLQNISKRMEALIKGDGSTFMMGRVEPQHLRPLVSVAADATIEEAARMMTHKDSNWVLVDFHGEYGIVSDSDLRKKVLLAKWGALLPGAWQPLPKGSFFLTPF